MTQERSTRATEWLQEQGADFSVVTTEPARSAEESAERQRIDVPAEETGHRILVAQAGSATSTRLRGTDPNAYNRITVENGGATIEVRLWAGKQRRSAETALPENR